jgi:hypothetical protein
MDLRGYRMTVWFDKHPEYRGLGDYFGTGTPRRKTLDEWVEFAKQLAAEHGGVLPNVTWIRENHRGLAAAMQRNPERFDGISQARLRAERKTPDEWVEFAKQLAAEHGGVLPNARWIKKNHRGLYKAMRRYPERFDGFKQEIRDNHRRLTGYRGEKADQAIATNLQ